MKHDKEGKYCKTCFEAGVIIGGEEMINELEEWAGKAGEDLLVTIRTCINVLKKGEQK